MIVGVFSEAGYGVQAAIFVRNQLLCKARSRSIAAMSAHDAFLAPQDVGHLHWKPVAAARSRNATRSQLSRDLAQRHPPFPKGQDAR
jgi:hypothetical protein